MPIRDALYGGTGPVLTLLFTAIVLLAAIACANLANVTIAEVTGRRDELTLRTALGASRASIVRLLAIEHAVVAVLGGALGLVASGWLLPAVLALDPNTAAQLGPVTIDWRVQAGALVLALLVSVISGVLPALSGTRGDLARGLAQGGRRTAGSRRAVPDARLAGGHRDARRVGAAHRERTAAHGVRPHGRDDARIRSRPRPRHAAQAARDGVSDGRDARAVHHAHAR